MHRPAERHVAGREMTDASDVLAFGYSARMLPSRLLSDPLQTGCRPPDRGGSSGFATFAPRWPRT